MGEKSSRTLRLKELAEDRVLKKPRVISPGRVLECCCDANRSVYQGQVKEAPDGNRCVITLGRTGGGWARAQLANMEEVHGGRCGVASL